jgi:hypothetical protein
LVDLSGKGDSQKPPRVGQLPIVDFDASAGILEVNDFDQLSDCSFLPFPLFRHLYHPRQECSAGRSLRQSSTSMTFAHLGILSLLS